MRAVDCQSFAGGFSLGVVQAGFELVGKREYPGGFGAKLMEGNRHLLGEGWQLQDDTPKAWEPLDAPFVFGNPPCSGFSSLSSVVKVKDADGVLRLSKFRALDNPINDCMDAVVHYGAACGAEAIAFESVAAAGKVGKEKMVGLRDWLDAFTGEQWQITHTFHNHLSTGGRAMRRRYFAVFTLDDFQVRPPIVANDLTLRGAIGALEDVPVDGRMDGHEVFISSKTKRTMEVLNSGVDWFPHERSGTAYARFKEAGFVLSTGESENIRSTHQFAPVRMNYDKHAGVINGGSLETSVHPVLPRPFTHREAARILGFPDDWTAAPAIKARSTGIKWWGKGIPVDSGRWLASSVKDTLEGARGDSYPRELIGDREYLVDTTNAWKS